MVRNQPCRRHRRLQSRDAPPARASRKKNPPGLSRRVLSQLSRGMSYEIRDCSNGSRRRLTNIPAGKPGGVTGGLGLHRVMEGVGSCSRLVRQVNSTRSSALPLPAGLFLARKSRRWCHHRDGFSERMYTATIRRSPWTCDRLSLMESYRTGKTRRRDRRAVSLVNMRSGNCVRSEKSAAPPRRRSWSRS